MGNGRVVAGPAPSTWPATGAATRSAAGPVEESSLALPAPAEETSPVTRVSVLAPGTRADLALPGDVPVAELLPVLVELTGADAPPAPATAYGEHTPVRSADRAAGTGWTLAPLGQAPVDPRRTLDGLGVLDGDQLVLRRRDHAAPAPLYDDVVDAVAESTPASYRPWDADWAHRTGLVAAVTAGVGMLGALLAAGRGPGTAGGLVTAGAAAVVALVAGVLAALAPRLARRPGPAAVLVALAAGAAAVCGLAAVPGTPGTALLAADGPHLLLASALALVTSGATLLASPRTDRVALAVGTALATAAALGTLVGAVATVAGAIAAARGGGPLEPSAVAAGAGAAAVVTLSLLPRLGIALARLPLPRVPVAPREQDGPDDADPADPAALDRRADRAHALLAGLAGGVTTVLVVAVGVLGLAPAPGWRGLAGGVLAVLLVGSAALRSRSYANAVPATVLLLGALVAGVGPAVGAVAVTPPGAARIGVAAGLAVVGVLAVLLGSVLPRRHHSPGSRRAVDLLEGVAIAAVVPLACAVADLYSAVRLL